MKKTILISAIAIVIICTIGYIAMNISYNNQNVQLEEQISSKIEDNQSHYTKMWEILKLQGNVAERYADDFKEIYPQLISGRYSNGGGALMKWIQEHNPDFDTSLYQKLMNSIEAQRESFHTTQRQLIDYNRQRNTLLREFPSRHFLAGKLPIDIPVIKNDETLKTFKTGKETRMDLFSSKGGKSSN